MMMAINYHVIILITAVPQYTLTVMIDKHNMYIPMKIFNNYSSYSFVINLCISDIETY